MSFCTIKRKMCWKEKNKTLREKSFSFSLCRFAEGEGLKAMGSFHSSCFCVLATGYNIKLLIGTCKRLHCNKWCILLSPSVQEATQLPVLWCFATPSLQTPDRDRLPPARKILRNCFNLRPFRQTIHFIANGLMGKMLNCCDVSLKRNFWCRFKFRSLALNNCALLKIQ